MSALPTPLDLYRLDFGRDGIIRQADRAYLLGYLKAFSQSAPAKCVMIHVAPDVEPDPNDAALVRLLLEAERVSAGFGEPWFRQVATIGGLGVANTEPGCRVGEYVLKRRAGYTAIVEAPIASAENWLRLFERLSWQGRQAFEIIHDGALPPLQSRLNAHASRGFGCGRLH